MEVLLIAGAFLAGVAVTTVVVYYLLWRLLRNMWP